MATALTGRACFVDSRPLFDDKPVMTDGFGRKVNSVWEALFFYSSERPN